MRQLVFAPYTPPADGEKIAPHVRVWALLFRAINNPGWKGGDDVLKLRATAKMIEKLETVQTTVFEVPDGAPEGSPKTENTRLSYDGGEVLLEDAEFARLEDAWKTYRPQLPGSLAVEAIRVIDFLDRAPEVEVPHIGKKDA